jgi:alpha-beta hydrolase superfamily lysophospholipase
VLSAQCSVLSAQCSVLTAQCSVLNAQCSGRSAQCSGRRARGRCGVRAGWWGLLSACLLAATSPSAAAQPAARQPVKHAVVVDGHQLAVWEKKPAQPRAIIVLLHGRTWSSLPNFDLQVPGERRSLMDALADAGLDVFAVDLRGYGATPRDAGGWLTPDRAIADVHAVVAWIHQRSRPPRLPVYLFGLSRGAMLAAMAAQQRPETVAGVVLFGFGFDPDAQIPVTDPAARPARARNVADNAASDFITKDAYTGATLSAFVRAALSADPVLVDWRDEHQFNAFRPAQMVAPVLLIHGDRDPQTPTALEAKLFTRFGATDKAWVIMPGADHAAHLEKSQGELVRTIVWFIRRHEA